MFNILYVEDDPASRAVLTMAQRMNPGMFHLTMFEDSYDFEAKLLKLDPQPDLILLDIQMRPYTGIELLKMIRAYTAYDPIPIIALTASVMNEEIVMLKTVGFQGVLSKPLNIDEFPHLIERAMNGENIWYVW